MHRLSFPEVLKNIQLVCLTWNQKQWTADILSDGSIFFPVGAETTTQSFCNVTRHQHSDRVPDAVTHPLSLDGLWILDDLSSPSSLLSQDFQVHLSKDQSQVSAQKRLLYMISFNSPCDLI